MQRSSSQGHIRRFSEVKFNKNNKQLIFDDQAQNSPLGITIGIINSIDNKWILNLEDKKAIH